MHSLVHRHIAGIVSYGFAPGLSLHLDTGFGEDLFRDDIEHALQLCITSCLLFVFVFDVQVQHLPILVALCHLQGTVSVLHTAAAVVVAAIVVGKFQTRHRLITVVETQPHVRLVPLFELNTNGSENLAYLGRQCVHQDGSVLTSYLVGVLQGTDERIGMVVVLQGHVYLPSTQAFVAHPHHVPGTLDTSFEDALQLRSLDIPTHAHVGFLARLQRTCIRKCGLGVGLHTIQHTRLVVDATTSGYFLVYLYEVGRNRSGNLADKGCQCRLVGFIQSCALPHAIVILIRVCYLVPVIGVCHKWDDCKKYIQYVFAHRERMAKALVFASRLPCKTVPDMVGDYIQKSVRVSLVAHLTCESSGIA